MSNYNKNVIPMTSRNKRTQMHRKVHAKPERRADAQREMQRRSAAAKAIAASLKARTEKLRHADRAIFAENLGKIFLEKYESEAEAKRQLRSLFENCFGPNIFDSYFKKRKRFLRFQGECREANEGVDGYGQYHASAREYVQLAEAMLAQTGNPEAAILRLVRGSSFDPEFGSQSRVSDERIRDLNGHLEDVLGKLRPKLTRLREALFRHDGNDEKLLVDPTGIDAFEVWEELPCTTVGSFCHKVPPFISIPLGASLHDFVEWTIGALRDGTADQCNDPHMQEQIRKLTDESSDKYDRVMFQILRLSERLRIEFCADCLGIADRTIDTDELTEKLVDHIGKNAIIGSDAISWSRHQILSEFPELSGATNQGILDRIRELDGQFPTKQLESESFSSSLSSQVNDEGTSRGGHERAKPHGADELKDLIMNFFAERDAATDRRRDNLLHLLGEQPCYLYFSQDVNFYPIIDSQSQEWKLAVEIESSDEGPLAAFDVDLLRNCEKEVFKNLNDADAMFGLAILYNLAGSSEIGSFSILGYEYVMSLGVDSETLGLYVAFTNKPGSVSARDLWPHIAPSNSEGFDYWLQVTSSREVNQLLAKDLSEINFGNYQNFLGGGDPEKCNLSNFPDFSMANFIINDLYLKDLSGKRDSSKLLVNLEKSADLLSSAIEEKVEERRAKLKEGLSWLKD